MASTCAAQAVVPSMQLGAPASEKCKSKVVSRSSFLGSNGAKSAVAALGGSQGKARVVCEAQKVATDRWAALGNDASDDQQDITRGKGMVDALFQGASGMGTQNAVLSSYDYVSQGQRNYQWDNMKDGFYIAPAFMDKIVVHLAKNFMNLPNIKVPLILGVWGGKGQGKSFQAELIFAKLGINPIVMSAGELESGNAGEPAKLIRQRYREASDIIKKGKMCCLFINDLDAGAGRMGGTTQYTVNNQLVNATLMNIADNPTNVQLPGVYNKEEIPRVPVIVTGNDFSTLYAPLIRDGRMEKFYWAPTREDRIGVCEGIFGTDGVSGADVTMLVDTFPGQSIDFFGALRARVYDDEVRKWVADVGVENIGKKLVNSRDGPPKFEKPAITLDKLMHYGNMLVQEQDNVKRVQLADKYLDGAELGNANDDTYEKVKAAQAAKSPAPRPPAPAPASSGAPSSGNGSYTADYSETPEEIVPILPKNPGATRGRRSSRRGLPRSRSRGENGSYYSGSESESEGYYSDSSYSSSAEAPAAPEEIVPIVAKAPPARGRGPLGRRRGPRRSSGASSGSGSEGAYSSGSESEAEGYYSDSTYSSYSPPAEVTPVVAKSAPPARGRGRSRKRGLPRTRSSGSSSGSEFYSSGSESESEYFSDSTPSYSYEPPALEEIVPIVAKAAPARGGRGRGRGRR